MVLVLFGRVIDWFGTRTVPVERLETKWKNDDENGFHMGGTLIDKRCWITVPVKSGWNTNGK